MRKFSSAATRSRNIRINRANGGVRGDHSILNGALDNDAETMLTIQVNAALHDSHSHINASKCLY
jgi:hypothetical protein